MQVVAAWELDAAAVIDELVLLATDGRQEACDAGMPMRELTAVDPLLSRSRTPAIWHIFRGMLFVLLSHNLLIESYVSRMKRLQRAHPNLHSLTLGHLFKYKVKQERARKVRRVLRSHQGGGLRRVAADADAAAGHATRAFGTANDNKVKLRELIHQLEGDAARYSQANIRTRGASSLRSRLRALRLAHDAREQAVAAAVNASLRRTCAQTRTGRERHIWAASECRLLLGVEAPPLFGGAKVKKHRGNVFKDVEVLKRAKVRAHALTLTLTLSADDTCLCATPQATRAAQQRAE